MTPLPPLPMRPFFVEKIWGGSRLAALPAKQRPGHRPANSDGVGEAWEVADLPEGQSVVDDDAVCAAFAGQPLGALVKAHGQHLVGSRHAPDRFPILVKLIDAADDLSVQVHPGNAWAAEHPGAFSKDEAWLVVDVGVDAKGKAGRVLHGFHDGVTRERFVAAIAAGTSHELMRSVDVKRGDVLHVSPGIVHAIGAGVVVLEVQEPSDTTFRVSDFGRKDASGKERPLHVEQALAVARFGDQPPCLETPRAGTLGDTEVTTLCETRSFVMRALQVNGDRAVHLPVSPETALVVHAEDGDVALVWQGIEVRLPRGGSAVLPASCGSVAFPARGQAARLIVMS